MYKRQLRRPPSSLSRGGPGLFSLCSSRQGQLQRIVHPGNSRIAPTIKNFRHTCTLNLSIYENRLKIKALKSFTFEHALVLFRYNNTSGQFMTLPYNKNYQDQLELIVLCTVTNRGKYPFGDSFYKIIGIETFFMVKI